MLSEEEKAACAIHIAMLLFSAPEGAEIWGVYMGDYVSATLIGAAFSEEDAYNQADDYDGWGRRGCLLAEINPTNYHGR